MPKSIIDQMREDAGIEPPKKMSIIDQMKADAEGAAAAPTEPSPQPAPTEPSPQPVPQDPAKPGFFSGLGDSVYHGVMDTAARVGNTSGMGRGFVGNATDFANGVVHGVQAPVIGLGQKALNLVAAGINNKGLNDYTEAVNDRINDSEKDYQANTPDSYGGMIGGAVGQIAPWMAGSIPSLLSKAPMLAAPEAVLAKLGSAAQTVAGAPTRAIATATKSIPYVAPVTKFASTAVDAAANIGAKGAAMAVTSPTPGVTPAQVLEGGARQAAVGAVLGAGTKGLTSSVGTVVKPIFNQISPMSVVGEKLPNIAGVSPEDYVQALRGPGASEYVPGSIPTVAQGGAQDLGANNSKMVQIERWMRSNVPDFNTAYATRGAENNGARLGALSTIAGTDAQIQAAKLVRQNAAKPYYDAAFASPVTEDPALQALSTTPVFKTGQARAQTLGENNVLDGDGNLIPPKPVYDAPLHDTEGLHNTALSIGDLTTDATTGMSGRENGVIGNVGAQLKNWLQANSPDYAKAVEAYRTNSVPVNNMEAGASILDGFRGSGADGAGDSMLALNKFVNLKDRALKGDYPPDAPTVTMLDGIEADLKRSTISNSGSPPGSSTALNLRSDDWLSNLLNKDSKGTPSTLASAAAGGVGLALGSPTVGAGLALGTGKVSSFMNARLMKAWQDALLNPATAADAIEAANSQNPITGALTRTLAVPPIE